MPVEPAVGPLFVEASVFHRLQDFFPFGFVLLYRYRAFSCGLGVQAFECLDKEQEPGSGVHLLSEPLHQRLDEAAVGCARLSQRRNSSTGL